MGQQSQTKSFFKGHANDWQKKAIDDVYSTINDRHRAVHRTLSQYPKGASILDVGCGTGQLAIEAAEKGFNACGVDFAEEMILIANRNAIESKSDASFEVGSIFEYKPTTKYDVISALGFIEYISIEQLSEFLEFSYQNLNEGGAISVGSRNRLFNMTTYNEYTEIEGRLDAIDELITESSIALSSNNTTEFLNKLRSCSGFSSIVQNETHPITRINVETRFQYTPSDLLHKLERVGFRVTNIYPVNYHAFNPKIADDKVSALRKEISEMISSQYQTDFRYLPNSSSFVMEAKK
jgi:SAM-dependent methyltransferase